MGRNKALLPFGDAPTLARYQFDRLAPLFSATCLSVKDASLFPDTLPAIADAPDMEDYAPTAGFVSIFRALAAERIFVIGVDTPFVDVPVIEALLAADREGLDAVIARTEAGMHPLCGIYHRSLLPQFESMAAAKDHALGKMLKMQNTVYVDFEDDTAFLNLNHPHEFEKALEVLRCRTKAARRGERSK